MTTILGISAFYHDSAAALLSDGEILAAAQEERFSRKKGDASFPKSAVDFCLKQAGLSIADIDHLVFYDKPLVKFDRLLETYLAIAPAGYRSLVRGIPIWMKEKLWLESVIRKESGYEGEIAFGDHHESHAASAFYPSPFASAAILSVDGVGEWSTTCLGYGKDTELALTHEIRFPHSLGLLYSALTYYLGFRVNSGEYKVMGLAPYGEPTYVRQIREHLIDIKDDGSFKLNLEYFNFLGGLTMTNSRFNDIFGGKPRVSEGELTQRHMDLARSVQEVTEDIILRLAKTAQRISGEKNLCLAGGVALNCVANGKVLRSGIFDKLWIQPAAGDAGGALGCALALWHRKLAQPRSIKQRDSMRGALLGPEYSDSEIESYLKAEDLPYRKLEPDSICAEVAKVLAEGAVVGWFQGRMEFGPRALGSRSILGDARDTDMQTRMNLKIKFRESFRPFAPVVKEERASEWFEIDCPNPYMLLVAQVHRDKLFKSEVVSVSGFDKLYESRSEIQAVTHVDNSARVQTVNRDTNPRYWGVLDEFEKLTGCPVLVNTSFNVRGEPIVESPANAVQCFLRTDMDYLCMGSFLIDKTARKGKPVDTSWRKDLPLD